MSSVPWCGVFSIALVITGELGAMLDARFLLLAS
jgi:hypothetical protein